ncbi:hypothetical protein WMF04_18400 [Sorangium sp. So ce260]|jgi:hypothetical protein|uniref:hypothetical protein n=1 Tax=Sorangium sp. So ce260 TaxID=3133291 RepID=UPI003F625A67
MLTLPTQPLQGYWSNKGTVNIWCPAPALLVTSVTGVLVEEGAAAIEEAMLRRVVEDGPILVFNDWEAMTDYDHSSRTRLTEATISVLHAIEWGHFLLGSKVVAFGVQVANTAIRKLTVHPSRAVFERALHDAIRERAPFGVM